MRIHRLFLLVSVIVAFAPALAAAQNVRNGSEDARFHLGRLSFTPKIGARNVGLDTNVFNAVIPEDDFTATFTGGGDVWMRVGRAHLSSKTTVDWDYFRKAVSQRSLNVRQEGRLDLDLLRIVPRVAGTFTDSRQRPNDEFDLRIHQRVTGGSAGVLVPLGSRVRVDVEFARMQYDFGLGKFGDAAVAAALNRVSETTTVETSVDLTPLTTFAIRADRRRDRFEATAGRDSTSVRVMPGLRFEPTALVAGSAFAGYRQLDVANPGVPSFRGFVAAVELRFVALDRVRVVGQFKRDVDYSLDLSQSFFVATTSAVEVTQALGVSWEATGRLRTGRLAYQASDPLEPPRTDSALQVGGRFARRVGPNLLVGIDIDYIRRQSVVVARAYDGMRIGSSVTYGF